MMPYCNACNPVARYCLLLAFLIFHLGAIVLFTNADYISYGTENELPTNNITDVVQDDEGFIWVGSSSGLYRYSGHAFERFYKFSNNNPLTSQPIIFLKNLGSNRLAISTWEGLQILITKTYEASDYKEPEAGLLSMIRKFCK